MSAETPIRIGLLQYGSVAWELDVMQRGQKRASEKVGIERIPLSSTNALVTALQADRVDLIVSDWIWVARQRAEGRHYCALPYSTALGGINVAATTGMASIQDLKGEKLGVAGGPLDKSWLLLKVLARRELGVDLDEYVEPVYGAPPLLSAMMERGRLPALLTFWQYSARLEASGYPRMLPMSDVLGRLGIDQGLPLLVWVADETWVEENWASLEKFLNASHQAKQDLADDAEVWNSLDHHFQGANEATMSALRGAFRQGVPEDRNSVDLDAVARLFDILVDEGGADLVGPARELPAGTFCTVNPSIGAET